MSAEPPRNLESDLRAYKQRRTEQLGAPLELHPATRRMLQGEVARAASRPLLTSEEAAKNFVRSFVMSHQQPGFFARFRARILWGGGMVACFVVGLLVLRQDPQQAARQSAFPDALPAPPPVAAPQPATTQPAAAPARSLPESETLARRQRAPATPSEAKDWTAIASVPPATSAPVNQRGASPAAAFAPAIGVTRETEAQRANAVPAAAPLSPIAKADSVASALTLTRDADRKAGQPLAEKREMAESLQVAKAAKAAPTADAVPSAAKESLAAQKRSLTEPAKQAAVAAGAPGAPKPIAVVAESAVRMKSLEAGTRAAAAFGSSQQFQQLDSRALYRQNLNSPPVPRVMQDFSLERTGDRVRIVDADGSTYEGAVLPALTDELKVNRALAAGGAAERKAAADQSAQAAIPAESVGGYRFQVSGVNRKLNQSVEFRGEWQPAPAAPAGAVPALQSARFGSARREAEGVDKQRTSATNASAEAAKLTDSFLRQQTPGEAPAGRITGRAVVGGRNEFDLQAVPK